MDKATKVEEFLEQKGLVEPVVVDPVEDYLEHHGIKGMRWGVITGGSSGGGGGSGRVPGKKAPKGSVTAGKGGGGSKGGDDAHGRLSATGSKAMKATRAEKKLAKTATPDAWEKTMLLKKAQKQGFHTLSNTEVQKLTNRLQMERKLSQLTPKERTRGEKILAIAEGGMKVYKNPLTQAGLGLASHLILGRPLPASKFGRAAHMAANAYQKSKQKGKKGEQKPKQQQPHSTHNTTNNTTKIKIKVKSPKDKKDSTNDPVDYGFVPVERKRIGS
jgi:hypothetical protein